MLIASLRCSLSGRSQGATIRDLEPRKHLAIRAPGALPGDPGPSRAPQSGKIPGVMVKIHSRR